MRASKLRSFGPPAVLRDVSVAAEEIQVMYSEISWGPETSHATSLASPQEFAVFLWLLKSARKGLPLPEAPLTPGQLRQFVGAGAAPEGASSLRYQVPSPPPLPPPKFPMVPSNGCRWARPFPQTRSHGLSVRAQGSVSFGGARSAAEAAEAAQAAQASMQDQELQELVDLGFPTGSARVSASPPPPPPPPPPLGSTHSAARTGPLLPIPWHVPAHTHTHTPMRGPVSDSAPVCCGPLLSSAL